MARYVRTKYRITNHKLDTGGGDPDRIFVKGCVCFYVEFKTKTGKLSVVQINKHKVLERLYGCLVYKLTSGTKTEEIEQMESILDEVERLSSRSVRT